LKEDMRTALILCALLYCTAGTAHTPPEELVKAYRDFAGSEANARALIIGLREKMSYDDVGNALALARASLEEHGIAGPTPGELQAALLGGSVTRPDGVAATLPGVLEMRAGGMRWGEIAQTLGYKLPLQKPQ
jgi:hypothetical protein